MKKFLTLTFLFLSLAAAPALAGGSLGLGYGFAVSPYKDYDHRHAVIPWINYEHEYFYLRGLSLGVKLYDQNSWELSAFVAYDPQRFRAKDSGDARLKRLDDRDDSFIAGGRAVLHHEVGTFSASLAGDISGHSGGLIGQASYAYPLDLDPLSLIPSVGLYWASEDYNDYYYGVSEKEAARSGLKPYRADAAFSPFAALAADLSLDEDKHFGLFARGEAIFLAPTIKDSPMVGRSVTFGLTTGVRYTFY